MNPKQSDVFRSLVFFWKIIGLWADKSSSIFLKIYSFLFVTLSIIYFFCYTLSLIYTPRTVDIFATQAIYYFSAFSGLARVIVVLIKRQDIISNFQIIDCAEFQSTNENTNKYLNQFKTHYTKYFKAYASYCSAAGYTFLIVVPIINYFLRNTELNLPVCNYYFLTEETRNKYFFYLFLFQTVGLVSTIMNNISCHTFQCGLIYMAIAQFKILNWNIANLRVDDCDITTKNIKEKENAYINKLKECLKHYEILLQFCGNIQTITDFLVFVQVGLATLSLCFCMYMFLLPLQEKEVVFLTCYTLVMLLENFVPSFLGSQLTNESDNLRFAAYSTDWCSRTKSFKICLMILIKRAQKPVIITGFKMVPLNLETFISIVKTAYSFYTLLRNTKE